MHFWTFLEVFGHVQTHSDAFGHVRIRSDAFGCIWMLAEGFGNVCFFSDFSSKFGRFSGFLTFGVYYDLVFTVKGCTIK